MLATASQTRSLIGSFIYDRALNKQEKGGHVVASNGIPQYASIRTQIAYMRAYCSNRYEVKAINIVLSHSSDDKKLLDAHSENKDKYVNDFLSACKKNGIDLDNTPWIMMEHINTDCYHYHMIILTTKFDGSRLDTGFIGKRAAKAAMNASKENGLHFAEGLEKREQARLKHIAKEAGVQDISTTSVGLSDKELAKLRKVSDENKGIKRRADARRAKAAEEAKERRNWVKDMFEQIANSSSSIEELTNSLQERGIDFSQDEKQNYTASIINDDRIVTYKLFRLGADLSLIDKVKQRQEELEKVLREKKIKDKAIKESEEANKQEKEQHSAGRGFHL